MSAVVSELEFSLPEYVRLLRCMERGRERFKKVISLIPGKRFSKSPKNRIVSG